VCGRIEQLGGTVLITTQPWEGTVIEMAVPLTAMGARAKGKVHRRRREEPVAAPTGPSAASDHGSTR
jgi:hypothetical protein